MLEKDVARTQYIITIVLIKLNLNKQISVNKLVKDKKGYEEKEGEYLREIFLRNLWIINQQLTISLFYKYFKNTQYK